MKLKNLNKKAIYLLTSLGLLTSSLNTYNSSALISNKTNTLEEKVLKAVETENDFTTIEKTENGYFEDVKIEGKTLVNLANCNKVSTIRTVNNSGSYGSVVFNFLPILKPIVEDKKYTSIVTLTVSDFVSENGFIYTDFVIRDKSDNKKWIFSANSGKINSNGTFTLVDLFSVSDCDYDYVEYYQVHATSGVSATVKLDKVILLEGDHTQNPPEYFEGIKSVGQNIDEINISSHYAYGNLFDINKVNSLLGNNSYIEGHSLILTGHNILDTRLYEDFFEENTQYVLSMNYENNDNDKTRFFPQIIYTDGSTSQIYLQGSGSFNLISLPEKTIKYIAFRYGHADIPTKFSNINLVKGGTPKPYTSYKQDKKSILYYNPDTQAWEKPILREWDSIEKHDDGKFYYHKRSEEVVFNGGEDWYYSVDTMQDSDDTMGFFKSLSASYDDTYCISNRFNFMSNDNMWNGNLEGISVYRGASLRVRIEKSKLSTQDISGFKKWLQDNPMTVVYQLREEKVYECSNIDLKTYQDETNFIIEGGAITPKVTLKYSVPKINELAKEAVEVAENDLTIEKLDIARNYVNQMKECRLKEQLQIRLNNLSNLNDMELKRKNATNNLDVYVKSENSLHMALSTNQISFNDYSGVNELEQLNAIEISINSSLPYQLNSYLLSDIKNSDGTKEIDIDRLNIKDNTNDIDIDYKEFVNLNTKLVLKDSCDAGNDIKHKIDLKLKGGDAYPADIYKTVIKFEAEQK